MRREFSGTCAYVRNCWYVAGWDYEVPQDTLFQRTIIEESILLYRTSSGKVVALDNKCCHRHAPLSAGRKEEDCVRCMYHGLKYDQEGRCIEIPGQAHIPANVRVRSYPVVERKRWIWIWMGNPEEADPTLIPDTFSLQDPAWRMQPGYLRYDANHLLIADNLLDFSHLSYVHEGSLGGTSAIAAARANLERLPRGVRLTRRISNSVAAPYHVRLGMPEGVPVDRWWIYDYTVPGILLLDSGVQPTAGPAEAGLRFHSCQAVTPENGRSTHYFFTQAHGFALHDAQVTRMLFQSVVAAFEEDRRMIEAQQQLIDTTPGSEMVGLPMDNALAVYRQIYQRMLGEEAQVVAAPEASA
jgi:vanillate O-demethylase monooxygenase subunit